MTDIVERLTPIAYWNGSYGDPYFRQEYDAPCIGINGIPLYTIEQFGELIAASQAVVDRWDTPLWKNVPHTAEFIERLRAALAKVKGGA